LERGLSVGRCGLIQPKSPAYETSELAFEFKSMQPISYGGTTLGINRLHLRSDFLGWNRKEIRKTLPHTACSLSKISPPTVLRNSRTRCSPGPLFPSLC